QARGGSVDVTATGHPARLASARSKLELLQDVRLNVQRFPLESVLALDGVGVRGLVNGAAYADGLDGGRVVARLEASELTLEGKTIPGAVASTMLVGGQLAAYVHMGGDQQFLRAELGARLAGQKVIDSAELRVDAQRFPVAAVLPLGRSGPLVVRGDLDGNARLTVAPGREVRQMGGNLRFSNGVFSLPMLGPALQGVSGDVRLEPNGRIELANVSARGVRGRIHGAGQLNLKGFAFDSGRFTLRADKGDEFALWVGGAPIGGFRGKVDFTAERRPNGVIDLRYDVPDAVLELPQPRAALRPLRDDPTIVIGVVGPDGRAVPLQLKEERAPGKSKFRLGGTLHRVRVTRPGQLEVIVQGDPVLELGHPLKATGEVQVQEGWVSVLGKRFQVERGTVRFVGDEISKSTIVASAVWVANDGTRVRVGVQGTLGELKTTLQSEPARSENEIVQLIMTGATEDTMGLEYKDPVATAVGGGAASRIVNDALAGIAPNVQTRVDTTNPLNPQPEVEVQASERVSVRFTTSLGQTAEGVDRSTTTVDYRAGPKWLISAKHGNTGSTAVDVLWQFRY
ncbi:MAG TPA: translocation/assembly module TamB domain-containing protein, partial [Polyangiaceae bacterium]|nr:translocation/assembly module TamB domain-containing protein [Polyangiaceae bacterium]